MPLTQKRSPQSTSVVQLLGLQRPPCGLTRQSSPDEQGIEGPQRIASQRLLIWLQAWPSPQPVTVQPGKQSVSPVHAQLRWRHTLPVAAVLHCASVEQVEGPGLQTPQPIESGARHTSGRPHSVSFLQQLGCGQPKAGHW